MDLAESIYWPIVGSLNGAFDTASNKWANADDGISLRNFELQMCFVSTILETEQQYYLYLLQCNAFTYYE